ncbi:MAG: ATP-binding protein [Coriobacteriales bacterium]|jgi:hypothetical protein|nr:ATP-binding protein [Coriobacteriales bacterium]
MGGTIDGTESILIHDTARIAVYDDLLSAPRVVDIQPQGVHEFIEAIAAATYEFSHQQGGTLPYTVIREITENFIHAGFLECTVSILDHGDTLRFADQGPGITKKDLVLQPGVSSATRRMKDYIRGVGSGFPIVREYLASSHGSLSIEDNAEDGTVVTITVSGADAARALPQAALPEGALTPEALTPAVSGFIPPAQATAPVAAPVSVTTQTPEAHLSPREEKALLLLNEHGMLGPVDLAVFLTISAPTATRLLQKLELLGMVESTQLKKRILSNVGMAYVQGLLVSGSVH